MRVSNFSLDWLSFTYCDNSSYDLISDFFDRFPELAVVRDEMVLVSGRNYSHGLTLNKNFTIRFDDDNNGKGVNVEIPSHGLEFFFSLFKGVKTVRDMFILLNDRGCVPSRLDLCFDDLSKTYRPVYYYKKFLSGNMVTRMRTCKMIHSGSDVEATTFYLGDRRKKMIRIYDKFKESNGEIDSVRYEIEIHSNASRAFFYHVIDGKKDEVVLFGDLLLSIFDIRRKDDSEPNKSRWDINEKWHNFIKSTFSQRFISISPYKPEKQVESIEKFALHMVSQVAFMLALHGDDYLKIVAEKGLSCDQVYALQKLAESRDLPPDFYINRSQELLRKFNCKGVI